MDLERIKLEKAMEGLEEFQSDFIKDRQAELAKVDPTDLLELSQLSHKWKGFAAPYGFHYLEKIALEIDVACKAKNLVDCKKSLDELSEYLEMKKDIINNG